MNPKSPLVGPLFIFIAGAVVAGLSWQGKFTSMMGFPTIFAVVCLVFGSLTLRKQPKVAFVARLCLVLLGAGLAFAGGFAQNRFVQLRNTETQSAAMKALGGQPAPALSGIKPLNEVADALTIASSFSNKATIVNFWSRQCTPCLRELPELNDFYQANQKRGLAVVAITTLGDDLGGDERKDELAKTRRLVTKLGLRFPVAVAASDDLRRSYMVRGFPSSALIDATGKVVAYGVGYEGGREVMARALDLLE